MNPGTVPPAPAGDFPSYDHHGQGVLKDPPVPSSAVAAGVALTGDQLIGLLQRYGGGRPCDVPCPPGLAVTVYNSDMSRHFSIPLEHVQITQGSIKYVDHNLRYGSQTRFRFQLCHNYLQRKCNKLSDCSYIHATQLPPPTQVHLNPFAPRRSSATRQVASATHDDPTVAHTYPTLAAGLFIPLFPPTRPPAMPGGVEYVDHVSWNAAVVVVSSDQLIVTVGATELNRQLMRLPPEMLSALQASPTAAAALMSALPDHIVQRARHCAHYQFKRLCNDGASCEYIHSKVPLLTAAKAQALQEGQSHGGAHSRMQGYAPPRAESAAMPQPQPAFFSPSSFMMGSPPPHQQMAHHDHRHNQNRQHHHHHQYQHHHNHSHQFQHPPQHPVPLPYGYVHSTPQGPAPPMHPGPGGVPGYDVNPPAYVAWFPHHQQQHQQQQHLGYGSPDPHEWAGGSESR